MDLTKQTAVIFYPSDATKPALAFATIPTLLMSSGAVDLMCQALADELGAGEFVCAMADGALVACTYGRAQRDLLDVLKA